jgi:hypothetical protein
MPVNADVYKITHKSTPSLLIAVITQIPANLRQLPSAANPNDSARIYLCNFFGCANAMPAAPHHFK